MSEGTPYRSGGETPVPICAECRHCRAPGLRDNAEAYVCLGFEAKMIRPAERNTITGANAEAWYERVRCLDKNEAGECDRFEVKSANDAALVRIQTVPWRRRVAGRLGSVLLAWSNAGPK